MSELTKEQTAFLKKHNTSVGSVFDATGMGKNDYRKVMKELGKTVAIGVTPCRKGSHTMRTRSGHCIQCNPASLAFQKRHSMEGYVYVAGSLSLSVIKVGLASDVENRMKSLNQLNYAGASDWKCFFWVNTQNAGRVEFDTHGDLIEYASPKVYQREGKDVHCLETFSCSAYIGIQSVRKNLEETSEEWEDKSLISTYSFESKTGSSFNRYSVGNQGQAATPLYRSTSSNSETNAELDQPNSHKPKNVSDEINHHDIATKDVITVNENSSFDISKPKPVKGMKLSNNIQDEKHSRTSSGRLLILGAVVVAFLVYLVKI